MKKILIISLLFLFSCTKQTHKIEFIPEKTTQETDKAQKDADELPFQDEDEIAIIEESIFFEENIEMPKRFEIDSSAQINIISQVPFDCFNLYDDSDLVKLKSEKTVRNTISLELPQDFFFNSIQAANEISEFAKTNPASIRGIFGNLLGITELVKGTQKVIFGIVPKNAKIIDFRFETEVSDDSKKILKSFIWKFNEKFNVSLSENKISMKRKTDDLGATKEITLENIGSNDPIRMLGENKELSAMLFKKSDLKLVKSDLQDFNGIKFDNFVVSAFFNPSLDIQTQNALAKLLKNTDYGKKLDYDLNILSNREKSSFETLDNDSIVIIYDADNLIAFETALTVKQSLEENTAQKIVAVADFGQKKQFLLDYDITISANSADLDKRFLSRKYLGLDTELSDLQIDLFEMNIYLVSMQKIIAESSIISNLEVAK